MAFLNGIFGTPAPAPAAPTPPAATPAVAGPPAGQTAATAPAPANGGPAPGNNAGAQPQPANSAMDALLKLMTPSAEVIAARQAEQTAAQAPILPTVTPEQINQSLANADFTTGIPQEVVAKALSGDAAALMQIMNVTARNAVAANLTMNQTLVEQGVRAGNDRLSAGLDSRFRELQLKNQTSTNPALNHPLAKSMLDTFSRNIAIANPRLTPTEVAQQAETNFLQMVKELGAPTAEQVQAAKPPERDWLRYLDDGSASQQPAAT